ncbi:MAG: putative signal transduction histidine kinase, with phosphoacceptor and binding domain [Nitrososphaeraceae archaeon]|nr:putative signal transduction histidine kinase, with phosphoacceptor and binding domain [Nitrososphaeraceae archaeon]
MLKFSEIRHLDGVKGNFEVCDEKEYVASTRLNKAEPIQQLIYSNVKEIVEQQQYIFDSFWNKAIPSEQKIREIEYGITPEVTEVIQSPEEAEKREGELLRKATKEIYIIYSTANAYHRQEYEGTIQVLGQLAEKGVKIKILVPTDNYIRESLHNLKHKQQQNIEFRNIASTLGIKIKSLVVDRKYSSIFK